MLGFTTYSQTALSESTTEQLAIAFVPSAEVVAYAGTLGYIGIAFKELNSASATSYANSMAFIANANYDLDSVEASASLGDFFNVTAQGVFDVTSLSAATAINEVIYTALANNTLASVEALFSEPSIDTQAKAVITTGSVNSIAYLKDLAQVNATSNIELGSFALTLSVASPTYTLDNFDYQALAEDYSKDRTLYLITYSNPDNTVYVKPENYTVTIQNKSGSNTVYIAA
jgi:hypothetical protein